MGFIEVLAICIKLPAWQRIARNAIDKNIPVFTHTTWQNSVTYKEIIRLSGILDEAQTTIPPYERPKIAKS